MPPTPKRKRVRMWTPTEKARVYIGSDKAREPGTLITVGAEVSEVRWDTGAKQFVPNTWLLPL